MNIKVTSVVFLIVAIIAGILIFFKESLLNSSVPQPIATTSPSQSADQYVGEISTTTSGQNVYTSTKYGFQFTYPIEWHVEDNIPGYVQLSNSNRPDLGQTRGFAKGENKIEVSIINGSDSSAKLFSETPDYPIKSRESISLNLAGATVPGVNVELVRGDNVRIFVVPLLHMPEKSLMIVIYGDPSNFHVLNDLVKSITWK